MHFVIIFLFQSSGVIVFNNTNIAIVNQYSNRKIFLEFFGFNK